MIKKILFACSICLSTTLLAQNCIPDASLTAPGYKPDSLQPAYVNVAYAQTLTVQSFKDTTTKIGSATFPVSIDSILVTSVKGLPPGINYVCETTNCRFLPLINSCVKISGTTSAIGYYPIRILITAYAKVNNTLKMSQKDSVTKFHMYVLPNLNTNYSTKSTGIKIWPVPAIEKLYIFNELEAIKTCDVKDLNGKNLSCEMNIQESFGEIQIQNLSAGIYYLNINGKLTKFIK